MNRISKFRAWDIESSEMIYTEENNRMDFFFDFQDTLKLFLAKEDDFAEDRKAHIMGFTNFVDKHEKDTYEGDIIQDEGGYIYIITWSNNCYSEKWGWEALTKDGSNPNYYYGGINFEYGIIGNIYENPELLK